MLTQVKNLEAAGRWSEILALPRTDIAALPAPERARVTIALAVACEKTATTPEQYRAALAYACSAVLLAEKGSFLWVWAQHLVASYASDLGRYKLAERAAVAFLRAVPDHPKAQGVAPVVRYHLGRVRAFQRRHYEALELFRQVTQEAEGAFTERARVWMAWTLAEAGRPADALAALPATVAHISPGHLSAASALIFAAAGDWSGARLHALAALKTRGEWSIFDTVQAAELYLVLKTAAEQAGNFDQARVWATHMASTLCGWNADLVQDLLPTLAQRGGEPYSKASSSCGPAGYARTGLLGTVG